MLCRVALLVALLQVTITTADKYCYKNVPYTTSRKNPHIINTTELVRRWYCLWICRTEERRTFTVWKYETYMEYRRELRCCDGYREEYSDCVPICRNGCSKGYCTAPDTCTCHNGHVQNVDDSSDCIPKCYPSCTNGKCTSPNTCTCNPGFKKSTRSVCSPICDTQCINGQCSSPNSCSCDTGYIKDPHFWYKCNPNCSIGCINGHCSAPNVCTCENGYEKDKNYQNKCVPVCPNGCVNGNCTSPNECTCKSGFAKEFENDTICNPVHDLFPNSSKYDNSHSEWYQSDFFTTGSLIIFLVIAALAITNFIIRKFPHVYTDYKIPPKWKNKFYMSNEERYCEKI